ncbi:MAG: flagellar motor protein MotB [Pseudomonadota bacterium]
MADEANRQQIIIKKVKKGGHGGHHGGAWKVAYADFVTAMMAFFLLMWLLNATTEEQKLGIADYFAPSIVTGSQKGADGVLGGRTITVDGRMKNDTSPIGITIALPTSDEDWEGETVGIKGAEGGAENSDPDAEGSSGPVLEAEIDPSAVEAVRERLEQEQFEKVEETLRQTIEETPELQGLAENLVIDQTPEGLRIQIVDKDRTSMFPSGSAEMFPHTRRLMASVVNSIKDLKNKVAIKGHTDATPYSSESGYSNWELSTDRANASRKALIESGLAPNRIASVVGRAAQDPFIKEDPFSPQNRRISIILLSDKPVVELPQFQSGNEN